MIARISEKSYRRGVQQGIYLANIFGRKHNDKDVLAWRFEKTLNAAVILPVGEEVGGGWNIEDLLEKVKTNNSESEELMEFLRDN